MKLLTRSKQDEIIRCLAELNGIIKNLCGDAEDIVQYKINREARNKFSDISFGIASAIDGHSGVYDLFNKIHHSQENTANEKFT